MIRQATIAVLVVAVAVFAAGACGRVAGESGSNTNWLRHCDGDADCGSGSECWCRACSTPCTTMIDCPGQSCRDTSEIGCGEPSQSPLLCVAACATLADCRSQGPGIECVNGACLPQADGVGGSGAGTSAGGSSGASSIGGSSGTSAAGGGGTSFAGEAGQGAGGTNSGGVGGSEDGGGPPSGLPDPSAQRVALTQDNTCITSGGKVYCWGNPQYGQLGFPADWMDSSWRATPTEVAGVTDIVGVALGRYHVCAFDQRGDVFCWGDNGLGQVGSESAPPNTCLSEFGDLPCQPTPTRVPGVTQVVELALDANRSCSRLADGGIRCWGDTGVLSTWAESVTSATSLSLAPAGACVTTASEDVSCSFELPASVVTARRLLLSQYYDGTGAGFGCAVGTNGSVVCFGDDSVGQLGDGGGQSPSALSEGAVALSVGTEHACALDAEGALACWGRNDYGQVGGYPLESPNCLGATCERSPRLVEGAPAFVAVGVTSGRTCGLAADETLWCWGDFWIAGAPYHLAGPWETGGDACFTTVTATSAEDPFENAVGCTTDSDCTSVSLSLSCNASCGAMAISASDAPALIAALREVESRLCPAAEAAGCHSEPLLCPEKQLRPVCSASGCSLDDPERTGCTDHCACALERRTPPVPPEPTCDGFDLIVVDSEPCGACENSWAYVLVGNAGTQPFSGGAALDFDLVDGTNGAPVVPDRLPLELELGPGEFAPMIRVASASRGLVSVRVSAAGDCEAAGDLWVDFPSPTNSCQ